MYIVSIIIIIIVYVGSRVRTEKNIPFRCDYLKVRRREIEFLTFLISYRPVYYYEVGVFSVAAVAGQTDIIPFHV